MKLINLTSLIPEEELKMIDAWRDNYGMTSSEVDYSRTRPIKEILQVWSVHKQQLAQIFSYNLILSRDISYKISEEELNDKMRDAMRENPRANAFLNTLREVYLDLTEENGHMQDIVVFNNLTTASTLVSNRVPWSFSLTIKGKPLVVAKNTKVSKILGKIAKIFKDDPRYPGLAFYEDFRIAHSQVLNQKVLKGTLCISIHPLDFLTMSDNNSGWESCMSWKDHKGDYRLGTVEMMNSPNVICAYLKSEKNDMHFPSNKGYTWNNKKWRELFILDEECIINVKGYPYQNTELEKIVLKWLKELTEVHTDWRYIDDPIEIDGAYDEGFLYYKDVSYGGYHFSTVYMYNDFFFSHFIYPNVKNAGIGVIKNIDYSGPYQCMNCGSTLHDFEDESFVYCKECEINHYCDKCGCLITSDGDSYYIDDEEVCSYCFDNEVNFDIFDNQYHLKSNQKEYDIYSSNNVRLGYMYTAVEPGSEEWNYFLPGVEPKEQGARWLPSTIALKDIPMSFLELEDSEGNPAFQHLYFGIKNAYETSAVGDEDFEKLDFLLKYHKDICI